VGVAAPATNTVRTFTKPSELIRSSASKAGILLQLKYHAHQSFLVTGNFKSEPHRQYPHMASLLLKMWFCFHSFSQSSLLSRNWLAVSPHQIRLLPSCFVRISTLLLCPSLNKRWEVFLHFVYSRITKFYTVVKK